MSEIELSKAFDRYQKASLKSVKRLERLAKEAEETDDYGDYDDECYDTWEAMWAEGDVLAAAVRKFLLRGEVVPG